MRIRREDLLVPVLAVLTAMLVGMIFIWITGYDAVYAYQRLFFGMTGLQWEGGLLPEWYTTPFGRTLRLATPLIFTGLAVAVAFRAGLFNIGGQGQMALGMIVAGAVALKLDLPGALGVFQIPLQLAMGALAGAAWGALAGWLKAVRGAHEVITTIMLNYVAYSIGAYLVRVGGPLQLSGSTNKETASFEPGTTMPVIWRPDNFTEVHVGLLLGLVVAALVWFVLERTALGYQIRAVGFNPEAARYGGMDVARVTVVAMALAGGLAGLAGVGYALGDLTKLTDTSFSSVQAGFTGIAVALLGRNHPLGVVFAALLFGGLSSGGTQIQSDQALAAGVGPKLVDVIQGCIIFFVGADAIFRSIANRVSARGRATPAGAPV